MTPPKTAQACRRPPVTILAPPSTASSTQVTTLRDLYQVTISHDTITTWSRKTAFLLADKCGKLSVVPNNNRLEQKWSNCKMRARPFRTCFKTSLLQMERDPFFVTDESCNEFVERLEMLAAFLEAVTESTVMREPRQCPLHNVACLAESRAVLLRAGTGKVRLDAAHLRLVDVDLPAIPGVALENIRAEARTSPRSRYSRDGVEQTNSDLAIRNVRGCG
jgi:hypothetical protein